MPEQSLLKENNNQAPGQKKTNYRLLLQKLNELAWQGRLEEKHKKILHTSEIWKDFSPETAIQWSRLCLICGLNDQAIKVLNWINKQNPDFQEAWQEHIDLLQSLNRRSDLVRLKAMATKVNPNLKQLFESYLDRSEPQSEDESGHDFDSPFAELKEQERLLEQYCNFFRGREDCFARQWADKKQGKQGYVPVRRAMDKEDAREHLLGRKTYGIYLLTSNSKVHLGVIDADLKKEYLENKLKKSDKQQIKRELNYLLQRIQELGQKNNIQCLVEFSGHKGYHFWFFFDSGVEAGLAKRFLEKMVHSLKSDLSCFSLEIFPKQESLSGKSLGNLVKLPLGLHRLSGKESYFLSAKNKEVWSQLKILDQIPKSNFSLAMENTKKEATQKQVLTHPRHEQWKEKYPELALLQEKCPALAQIMARSKQSKSLDIREEKILLGTIGFLARRSTLLHHLFQNLPEYNPHYVDLKISQIRGSVLGCRKIHDLLGLNIDFCQFENSAPYMHPLLHCPDYWHIQTTYSEKVENLQQALENLQKSMDQVYKFLPKPKG